MTTSLQRLTAVLELLDSRDWRRLRETQRFFLYVPPGPEGEAGYELVVPRNTNAPDFDKSLAYSIDAIASYYRTPFSSLEALLLPSSEIVAIQLKGESFTGGAAPFPRFERTLEHLKRTISRAASFVLTDDPLTRLIPAAAYRFLDDCWFLQTARGSFVTRVALPTAGSFGRTQLTLFAHPPAKGEVVSAMRNLSRLLGERILEGDDQIYAEGAFEQLRPSLSVGVLEEFGKLLRGSEAERVDLSFRRGEEEMVVTLPNLSAERLRRVDHFVAFARERLHASFDLEVVGRIFDVRRSRRGTFSFVGLEGMVDNRPEYITFKVEAQTLAVMLQHLQARTPIRVSGRARRLRTQIRIERDFAYEEV